VIEGEGVSSSAECNALKNLFPTKIACQIRPVFGQEALPTI
jgi:hypothetical protein